MHMVCAVPCSAQTVYFCMLGERDSGLGGSLSLEEKDKEGSAALLLGGGGGLL